MYSMGEALIAGTSRSEVKKKRIGCIIEDINQREKPNIRK